MKPTAHIAKPAATPKTGRFALLCGPHCSEGSGAPARGPIAASFVARSLVVLCALAGLFALVTVGVAQAEVPRLISAGSFPATNPLGVAVDDSCSLHAPPLTGEACATFDASAGDVFVAALFEANISKFDASVPADQLSPPSPFGEGFFSSAVVNPASGDVYVMTALPDEAGNVTIQAYDSSTGVPVGTPIEAPPSSNFGGFYTVVQIGVDSAGDVYVPVTPQNELLEYSPAGTLLNTFTGGAGLGALKGPTGVAVDASGNLWVADSGDNRIEELSPADVQLGQIASEGVQDAIALDGHGDVLAIVKNGADFCGSVHGAPPCSHLVEYDSAGVQVADLGAGSFETGEGPIALPPLVAVDEASGLVYVTDLKGGKVWVFARPTAPRVEHESSAEVTGSEAKLGALVNAGGLQTTYRFEYDTRPYAEGEAPHGQSAPFPQGSVGEGLTSHTVWGSANGLTPGTTYHYRVIATNELAPGGVAGPDQTFTTETAAEQAACRSNEQFRGGFSAALPDCRAYELVTPATKTSVQILSGFPDAEGDAGTFNTHEPLPGAPTASNVYDTTRTPAGWIAEDIMPLESYTGTVCDSHSSGNVAQSADFSRALIVLGGSSRASEPAGSGQEDGLGVQECNAEGLQVVAGEPVGYVNLLVRDNSTGAFRLVNAPMAGVTPADARFKGASGDLSHVVFSELAKLTPEAPHAAVGGPEDLYEWDEGALRLLTVLPGEVPAHGSLVLEGAHEGSRGISAEGSHILFTSGGGLYARIDGSSTVQVDASQTGGPEGGGSFQTMSADGSRILFTDENELTAGSTAAAGEPDLYECVLREGASRCELSDLTVATGGEPADVQTVSPFGSQDSSHVYFVAKGVLAEGAVSGQKNLYAWDAGKTTLIATLAGADGGGGVVSPDGTSFAFTSRKSLTGYNNTQPGNGPVPEIFLYGAGSASSPPALVCASCNPSGEAPAGEPTLASAAARPLSDSDGGRLFFDTSEALVPSDTNNQVDVYEYEDGRQSLISSGTSASESVFDGASESGDDVFFHSRQQLVPQDDTGEEARVIYDARVGGGFPAAAAPLSCGTADACRVPVAALPSVFGAPASATFSGAGNLAPPAAAKPKAKPKSKPAKCRDGFVKKRGKCTKKPKRKAKKSAHANKRTGK